MSGDGARWFEAVPAWDLSVMTTTSPEALREQAMGPVGMVTVSPEALREHVTGPIRDGDGLP
jgi:hypothetical protein